MRRHGHIPSSVICQYAGFDKDGLSINPDKTKLNFDMANAVTASPLLQQLWYDGAGNKFLPWCGLLINTSNLEIQADYSRYEGRHLTATLTLPLMEAPGQGLLERMPAYLNPKCAALLLDASLCSPATVRLNIYQSFLLAAMKFHCHHTAMQRGHISDTRHVISVIEAGISFMTGAAGSGSIPKGNQEQDRDPERARKQHHRLATGHDDETHIAISGVHVRWLGLHAFAKVLRRKQAVYTSVLAILDARLNQHAYRWLPSQLSQSVDWRRSSAFDGIKY